jgi:hypothetical protein
MEIVGNFLGIPVGHFKVEDENVTYPQFQTAVGKFRPKDVIRAICHLLPAEWEAEFLQHIDETGLHPHTVAGIVRESLVSGNNSRPNRRFNLSFIYAHCIKFNSIYYAPEDKRAVLPTIAQLSQQLEHAEHESDILQIARTIAVLDLTRKSIASCSLTDQMIDEIFDGSLVQGLSTLIDLWQLFLEHPEAQTIPSRDLPAFLTRLRLDANCQDELLRVLKQITTGRTNFKQLFEQLDETAIESRQWSFNPLTLYPVIAFSPSDPYFAPIKRLILRRGHLSTVIRIAARHAGQAGINAQQFYGYFGFVLQMYIGNQLRQIPNAQVFEEIKYGPNGQLSIDWFLVLPSTLVLIECKSATLNIQNRAGEGGLDSKLAAVFNIAIDQINTTFDLLNDPSQSEFRHIPQRENIVGIIITGERIIYGNNFKDLSRSITMAPRVPLGHMNLSSLELLATCEAEDVEIALVALTRVDSEQITNGALDIEKLLPINQTPNDILVRAQGKITSFFSE